MRNLKMRKVAKEIFEVKVSRSTLNSLKKKFYQIMRDNNIKEGEWSANGIGRRIANLEWTICKDFFINHIKEQLNWELLLLRTPKDLEGYGKQPVIKHLKENAKCKKETNKAR